jgi:hypothetical protein
LTNEQRALAQGEIAIGRALGVGGFRWNVTRATGDGVAEPVTTAVVGTWIGYVAAEKPQYTAPSAPGVAVPAAKRWYAVGWEATVTSTTPTSFVEGDVISSQTHTEHTYVVAAVDTSNGYCRCVVTKL